MHTEPVKQPEPKTNENGNGDEPKDVSPFKGAEIADPWAKAAAFSVLVISLAYCVLGAGLAGWSHGQPFQADVNFALFAAFIVVAGAIERFLEPVLVVLPPYEKKADAKASDSEKDKAKGANESAKADRALLAYCIALVVGIVVSSLFGLYFLETMGVATGNKAVRGLDIFITALIITGGTKPLHDMITSIEKKKEVLGKDAV